MTGGTPVINWLVLCLPFSTAIFRSLPIRKFLPKYANVYVTIQSHGLSAGERTHYVTANGVRNGLLWPEPVGHLSKQTRLILHTAVWQWVPIQYLSAPPPPIKGIDTTINHPFFTLITRMSLGSSVNTHCLLRPLLYGCKPMLLTWRHGHAW